MVLIRLAYAADLPTPDEIIEKLANAPASPGNGARAPLPSGGPRPGSFAQAAPRLAPREPDPEPGPDRPPEIRSFSDIVALAGLNRDVIVKHALESQLSPVSLEPGRLEVALADGADPQIIQTLSARLRHWTGRPWMVTVSTRPLAPTLRQQRDADHSATLDAARDDPLVREVLSSFPGSRLVAVRRRGDATLGETPPADPQSELDAPITEDEGEDLP
ncbi:MAG: hypothetical protein WD017_03140 [Cucumibacter sp.]